MGEALVARKIDAPAHKVWDLISWRGMAQSAGQGIFSSVEFEDDLDAPGSTKILHLGTGERLRERLEWVDPGGLAYGYRVLDGGALPVASYEGVVRITAMGPAACAVVIRCSFVGVTVSDDDYTQIWRAMEKGLLDGLAAQVE